MDSKNICIIGAGLAGCTIARCLAEKGYHITIFEKQNFIGGNCYDFHDEYGVLVHKYGPHIFHTNYENVWNFVNRFSKFNNYINQVLVKFEDDDITVPFPINLISIKKLFPHKYDIFYKEIEDKKLLGTSISISELLEYTSLKESHEILDYLYKNVYANYTAKMWGVNIKDVDPDVIKRVKINLNEVWNYFPNDKYCGLPINGYTELLSNMVNNNNIKIHLNSEPKISFSNNRVLVDDKDYDNVVYTGSLDALLNYKFGDLPYRSIELKFEHHNKPFFQLAPIINYPSNKELTRICEYKYLTKQEIDTTTISYEYPGQYDKNGNKWNIPFYPINNSTNIKQYTQYVDELKRCTNLFLCGRLAEYKYYDMDDIIFSCLNIAEKII